MQFPDFSPAAPIFRLLEIYFPNFLPAAAAIDDKVSEIPLKFVVEKKCITGIA